MNVPGIIPIGSDEGARIVAELRKAGGLAAAGVVRHIVTTNYDVGIERAFRAVAPHLPLTLVRGRTEAPDTHFEHPHVLFKIHGCASPASAPET